MWNRRDVSPGYPEYTYSSKCPDCGHKQTRTFHIEQRHHPTPHLVLRTYEVETLDGRTPKCKVLGEEDFDNPPNGSLSHD
jgi:hypothetical protein